MIIWIIEQLHIQKKKKQIFIILSKIHKSLTSLFLEHKITVDKYFFK